jgi:SAM-dependent methyltransferase
VEQFDHDGCLSIFGDAYAAGGMVFPPHATVLEIGCAEADWMRPMKSVRPDLQITGVDWRRVGRDAGTVIHGDILVQDFPAASFDVVVGISSIEHIGLGHYSSDPLYEDGDVQCMALAGRWLKPGGWAYFDVPYGPEFKVHGTEYRRYDEATLQSRLIQSLTVAGRWWVDYTGFHTGIPTNPHAIKYVAVHAIKEKD